MTGRARTGVSVSPCWRAMIAPTVTIARPTWTQPVVLDRAVLIEQLEDQGGEPLVFRAMLQPLDRTALS